MSVGARSRNIAVAVLVFALVIWMLLSTPASPLSPAVSVSNPPPGTGSGGITDVAELISYHRDTLEHEEYRLLIKYGASRNKKTVVKSEPGQMIVREDSRERRVTTYVTQQHAYSRITYGDGKPKYEYDDGFYSYHHEDPLATTQDIVKVVTRHNFRPVKVIENDGERKVKFELKGGEHADGYLIVRDDGLVKEVDLSTEDVSLKMRYETTSNVDVRSPTWTDKARRLAEDGSSTTGGGS